MRRWIWYVMKLTEWIFKYPQKGIIAILIVTNSLTVYRWSKSIQYGNKMFLNLMDVENKLDQQKDITFSDMQNFVSMEMRERDSIINVLQLRLDKINKKD